MDLETEPCSRKGGHRTKTSAPLMQSTSDQVNKVSHLTSRVHDPRVPDGYAAKLAGELVGQQLDHRGHLVLRHVPAPTQGEVEGS